MSLLEEAFLLRKNKKGGEFAKTHPPEKRVLIRPQKNEPMIIHVFAKLNEIFEMGMDYPWQKPGTCPNCNCFKIWGHGFVLAFFDGFNDALLIRRYRYPDCRCVLRLRPRGFFSRFQAPVETIRSSISNRLHNGKWLPHISRTRQNHWYRALKRRVLAYFDNSPAMRLDEAFDYFAGRGISPVSRSI